MQNKRNITFIVNHFTSNSLSIAKESGTSPGGPVKVSELLRLQVSGISLKEFTRQGARDILRLFEETHRHPKANWPAPRDLTQMSPTIATPQNPVSPGTEYTSTQFIYSDQAI